MLTARVLPPSLKTENRTSSPVTAPSGCIQQSAGVADRVAATTMPTFNIHITTPAPGLQHLSVSFTAAFPLQAVHSPLKKPNQAARRPSPGSMQSPPGALTGSPGGGDTSSAGTGLLGTGASPADPDSVGTAAAPAQLAVAGMGPQQKLLLEQQEYPGRRDYPIQYKKRPADFRRTGRI